MLTTVDTSRLMPLLMSSGVAPVLVALGEFAVVGDAALNAADVDLAAAECVEDVAQGEVLLPSGGKTID